MVKKTPLLNEYIVQVTCKSNGYFARDHNTTVSCTSGDLQTVERLAKKLWGEGEHICYSLRHHFPYEAKYANTWRMLRVPSTPSPNTDSDLERITDQRDRLLTLLKRIAPRALSKDNDAARILIDEVEGR